MQNKMRILLLYSALLLSFTIHAQNKLLLCTTYDARGNYTGDFPDWKIHKTGNFMYVYFRSSAPIYDTLYLSLQKTFNRKDSTFYEFDHYYLVPDSSKKWAVNKYIFSKPGKYRLQVYDRNTEKLLATHITDIEFADEEYSDPYFADTWYYKESGIFFCESISDTGAVGKKTIFPSQPQGTKIMLYIEQTNKRELRTDHLFVKIYSKDTHELLSSGAYSINRKWYWTYIPVFLQKTGNYDIEVYNDDDTYINHGEVEIR